MGLVSAAATRRKREETGALFTSVSSKIGKRSNSTIGNQMEKCPVQFGSHEGIESTPNLARNKSGAFL